MDAFWFSAVEDHALLKLCLALLLGGLVGFEREWHGRAAGLRTHVLVCLGATILLIGARSACQLMDQPLGDGNLVLDPNRISAGIVTGIGFLGAGAIIRMGDLVRGLTTAACIWFVAALGIIIGNGLFGLAIIATLIVLLVLVLFDLIEHHVPVVNYRSIRVQLGIEMREEFETWCRDRLIAADMRIQEVLSRIDTSAGIAEVIFRVRTRGTPPIGKLIQEISAKEGVRLVRWDQD